MHTSEPWAVNCGRVESKNEHGVVNDGWIIAEFSGPQYRDNAKRVRDCVNALAGVPDPAAFMAAVDALIADIEEVPELNISNYHHEDVCQSEGAKSSMFDAWNNLRSARGKH